MKNQNLYNFKINLRKEDQQPSNWKRQPEIEKTTFLGKQTCC